MEQNEAVGVLGLATRARKTISGEMIFKKFANHEFKLMILAEDIGNNSKKKLLDKCKYYQIPVVSMDAIAMNRAMGTNNRKFVAIVDEGFAQKLHTCLKG